MIKVVSERCRRKENEVFLMRCGVVSTLVVGIVLVHHWVQDVAHDDGLHVVEEHVHPHAEDCYRETVAYEQDSLVLERGADRDGGDDEPSIWEHHGPPSQVEIESPSVNDLRIRFSSCWNRRLIGKTYSNKSDHEEPHSQNPKEQRNHERHCSQQLGVNEPIALEIEVIR
jgi:hypothetical protein